MRIPEVAHAINVKAPAYQMGTFQALRKKLKRLTKVYTQQIFANNTIHEEWAFHSGGRQEIQYNIGLEEVNGLRILRHGLAFSLEPSRSFPDISILLPKIERFNDYVREAAWAFPDMKMWHEDPQGRSEDYAIRAVPPELFKPHTFIFMGKQQDIDSPDIDLILRDFDRLLPLYEFVEGEDAIRVVPSNLDHGFVFQPGCSVRKSVTTMTIAERRLDVTLHHNDLQYAVHEYLVRLYGQEHVGTENRAGGGRRIDVVVEVGDERIFYEIKISTSLQSCIREAVGQLLEYSYWASTRQATKLVLVTENESTQEAKDYLRLLREKFGLPIYHQRYDPGTGTLSEAW